MKLVALITILSLFVISKSSLIASSICERCQTFSDGCNTCQCTDTGFPACTKKACLAGINNDFQIHFSWIVG